MKQAYKYFLIALSLVFLSCSNNKDDNSKYLTMDMGSSSGILIPAPSTTQSCAQVARRETTTGAVAGTYFTLPNPVFRWNLEESPVVSEVRVIFLKLSLKSPKIGGEYNCTFSDEALGSMYYKRSVVPGTTDQVEVTGWDGILGKGSVNSTNDLKSSGYSLCSLRCGGLSLPTKTAPFSVTGTWEVLAVQKKYKNETSSDYEELPLKIQGSFTVENVLNTL